MRSVREGLWIGGALLRVLAILVVDRVRRVFVASAIPLRLAELEALPTLRRALAGSTLVPTAVAADAARAARSANAELGAGGTGTSRAWLGVATADGSVARVFVKLPAAGLFEQLFLTVFGVYRNEVAFYRRLLARPRDFPEGLFARVHVASIARHRFVLVLEDLAARDGGVDFPTVDAPHPPARVRATLEAYAKLHAATWNAPPRGVWTDAVSAARVGGAPTRPPFLHVIADATLAAVVRRWPDLLPPGVLACYRTFLANYEAVRDYWSAGTLALVHGDAHLGNIFFHRATGAAGFYDLQCVAAEHPMRDVAYHLTISCDSADLAARERAYVAHYVQCLGAPLDVDAAWFEYRLHALWALAALVISAGATADLFEERMARLTIGRVAAAMARIDTAGALADVLRGRRAPE